MKTRFRHVAFGLLATIAVLSLTGIAPSPASSATTGCSTVTWGSLQKSSTATNAKTHPTNVRTGKQQCYDRFVIDLDGASTGAAPLRPGGSSSLLITGALGSAIPRADHVCTEAPAGNPLVGREQG